MSIKFSENQINLARKRYYGKFYFNNNLTFIKILINKILILFFNLRIITINFKRKIFSFFIKIFRKLIKNPKKINCQLNIKQSDLTKYSLDLEKNHFTFINDFFTDSSHKSLLENWPNINFFSQSSNILKFYSRGFTKFNNFDNQELKKIFLFLKSSEFEKFINQLLQFEMKDYYNYSIGLSLAGNNSYLVPHIDGLQNTKSKTYNFIFFIDGNDSDPSLSGATGLYSDNNFEKPFFIPSTMKNSVLIYNSTSEFYHGFNFTRLQKKIYRKTINFQFFPKEL